MAGRGGAFVVLIILLCSLPVLPLQACLVPAMFVFGDSLVDVGNNDHLPNVNNTCKANFRPYGVDYRPKHVPTGRFSNGYNLADQLAQQLGFVESPPPFLSLPNAAARFSQLTSKGGINFASGGSGLLPTTGGSNVCGCEVISMGEQVGNFTSLVGMLKSKKGRKQAAVRDVISESLFFISVGSNDLFEYSDHYADPRNRNDPSRNDTAYLRQLVDLYAGYIKVLYTAGATKFSVVSPSLVGCSPMQRKVANDTRDMDESGCLATANNLSRQLYPMIESMLQSLSQNDLPGMNYSLGDAITMAEAIFADIISKPPNNIISLDHPCCGKKDFGETGCNSSVPLCHDRTKFFFWDRFHPTDWVSAITAEQLFLDNGTFVHPVNVQQLVAPAAAAPSP